jgi:protein-S-isoprenylcysteine O-methyltransferase Ste14
MRREHWHELAGFGFFTFATLVSTLAAWEHPSLLGWLYAAHNGLLACVYSRRLPAISYDRIGLWLGMIAAFLPTFTPMGHTPWFFILPALSGYGLILWSLVTLGPRFGIAPADRGLTSRGPYRFIRHPMYLGEIVFRIALIFSSPDFALAGLLATALVFIQSWRILREENLISGYSCYARIVHWRLMPGLW